MIRNLNIRSKISSFLCVLQIERQMTLDCNEISPSNRLFPETGGSSSQEGWTILAHPIHLSSLVDHIKRPKEERKQMERLMARVGSARHLITGTLWHIGLKVTSLGTHEKQKIIHVPGFLLKNQTGIASIDHTVLVHYYTVNGNLGPTLALRNVWVE